MIASSIVNDGDNMLAGKTNKQPRCSKRCNIKSEDLYDGG